MSESASHVAFFSPWTCGKCGKPVRDYYCGYCGAKRPIPPSEKKIYCNKCKKSLPASFLNTDAGKYCGYCGSEADWVFLD